MNCHVLVSTGNNIANLIPLLENSMSSDWVYIINSETALEYKWTDRFVKVLREHNYQQIHSQQFTDSELQEIEPVANAINQFLEKQTNSFEKIIYYLNGGQKMTAISQYLSGISQNSKFIYLSDKPVEILTLGLSGKSVRRLVVEDISLNDVLIIYNSKIFDKSNKIRYRPGAEHKGSNKFRTYYRDNQMLVALTKLQPLYRKYQLTPEYEDYLIARFSEITQQTIPVFKTRLDGRLPNTAAYRLLKILKESSEMTEEEFDKWYNVIESDFSGIMGTARKIIREEMKTPPGRVAEVQLTQNERDILVETEFLSRDADPLHVNSEQILDGEGYFFEQAVTTRFLDYLAHNPIYNSIISEIWTNVKVVSLQNPDMVTGEYDLLVLLKNGKVISLECKTHKFEEKDIFARVARLVRRTGLLAEQWVVAPFFTDSDVRKELMLQFYYQMKALEVNFIPFGSIGQSNQVYDDISDQTISVIDFEESLKILFDKYLPKVETN